MIQFSFVFDFLVVSAIFISVTSRIASRVRSFSFFMNAIMAITAMAEMLMATFLFIVAPSDSGYLVGMVFNPVSFWLGSFLFAEI